VPINNLMEDAATAEICRAQLWQWAKNSTSLADGTKVTLDVLKPLIANEVTRLSAGSGGEKDRERVALAGKIFEEMVTSSKLPEFLTTRAYDDLLSLAGDLISPPAAPAGSPPEAGPSAS